MNQNVEYHLNPPLADAELNALYAASWPRHRDGAFGEVLARSLVYVCAYSGSALIGFVYLAWDGGQHAFLLDPTVHPNYRRHGIGRELVRRAVEAARARGGLHWVHVDFEPHLRAFYAACGFRPTDAGLIRLDQADV
jgi:GNAT superfamily N-acetyltransferase